MCKVVANRAKGLLTTAGAGEFGVNTPPTTGETLPEGGALGASFGDDVKAADKAVSACAASFLAFSASR